MKKYVNVDGQDFSVSVSYNKGGMNYFTAKEDERGYYLHVRPVELSSGDGYTSEMYTLFSGYRQLLKSVKRQSEKSLAESIKLSEPIVPVLINKVLSEIKK